MEKDRIVYGEKSEDNETLNVIRIPNPRNEAEVFSFRFNAVYDMEASQEELFTQEGNSCFVLRV